MFTFNLYIATVHIHASPAPATIVTPTRKLERPQLREHYTHAIEQLYQDSPPAYFTPFAPPHRRIMAPRGPTANTQALEAETKIQDDDTCIEDI